MKSLILFDVDGTLSESRKQISSDMVQAIEQLKRIPDLEIGIVGGSNLIKQKEQLGDCLSLFKWIFSENGLVAYKDGSLIHQKSIVDQLGEELLKSFIDFNLNYMSKLNIPKKRGTFIEFRTGMINLCPVGRNCSYAERLEFFQYDRQHQVRQIYVEILQKQFGHLGLKFSIGGQISIDVFPRGWDKTYCLQHVESENYNKIYFFGDRTGKNGNDYEIYHSPLTIGYTVKSPQDTLKYLKQLFI